jgi:hypothetical protein
MLRPFTPRKPLEKSVEKAINKYAKRMNVLTYKFTSPAHRGVPDRIFVAPSGMVGFLEIKRPGRKPTDLQTREIQKLVNSNAYAGWADTVEKGKAFIDGLLLL